MGYTTEFKGRFNFDRVLDDDTYALLKGLSSTRRMKRKGLDKKYGEQGEFFFDPNDFDDFGQTRTPDIVDYNSPPDSQPGLWLKWEPTEDRQGLIWNENEKFYYYIEWLEYLILKILKPNEYVLNGRVLWQGEDFDDRGVIIIENNNVSTKRLSMSEAVIEEQTFIETTCTVVQEPITELEESISKTLIGYKKPSIGN